MSSPPPPPTVIPTETLISNPPPIIQALSYSPLKKPQPIPWSHEETLNLIKAYQEKWYSLKRGQLKASQWEEVAITVAARCGLDEPSKSGTQCRHKIEKLRKRYRAEKQKLPLSFNYQNHPWIYFSLMDHLERGPLPISAVSPLKTTHHHLLPQSDDDDYDDSEVGFTNLGQNFDGFLRKKPKSEDLGNGYKRGGEFNGGNLNFRDLKKRKTFYEEEDDDEEDNNGGDDVEERERKRRSGNLMGELGAQIREIAERFVRMEGKKIELMRETENLRMEMENKRMEMIIVGQHKIVELISKAFNGASSSSSTQKKVKVT